MPLMKHIDRVDHRLSRTFNRFMQWDVVHRFFSIISRLGDGPMWYLLMVTLPLLDNETSRGLQASGSLLVGGFAGLMVYRGLKQWLARERPFITYADIDCRSQPLDRYSFPSGHTLHAVLFTTIATAWFPSLAFALIPLTGLIALSRLVLGLHYPTDVIVGAFIGWGLAQYVLILLPPSL